MVQRSLSDVLLLVLVALAAAWAGAASLRLTVDAENLAMKSEGTAVARAEARKLAVFGDEPTLLALLRPVAASVWDVDDQRILEEWSGTLASWPRVESVQRVPIDVGAGVLLAIVPVAHEGRYADATTALVARLRAEAPATTAVDVTGQPVLETVLAAELRAEQALVVPVLVASLLAFLLIVYRSPSPALGALAVPLAGVALLGGTQVALGIDLDPVSSLLAPAVLTVGVASSIHVVERVRSFRRLGEPLVAATRRAADALRRPFVLTATTTVAGFAGLSTSPIPAVRRFAWLASLGVAATSLLAWLVLPAFLRTFGCPPARVRPVDGRASTVAATSLHRSARPLALATLAVALAFGVSWSQVRVDTDPLELLPKDHALRAETARVAAVADSIDRVDLMLAPPHPSPRTARMLALQARLEQAPGIAGPCGPPRAAASGELLVPLLLAPGGSSARIEAGDAAVRTAHALGWPDASVSGLPLRVAEDSAALVDSQLRGLGLTLALLWAVMAVGFRSPSLATLGLAPNVLPCLLVYGGLALVGRPLSVASALIGAVMLGLVVDDTIHMLHAYAEQRRRGRGVVSSVTRALRLVARPLTVTSTCLAVGFATTLLGRLATTREFGALAIVTVFAALAADLLVLPALLSLAAAPRGARGGTAHDTTGLLEPTSP